MRNIIRDTPQVELPPLGEFVPLSKFKARWAMFFGREVPGVFDAYFPTDLRFCKPTLAVPRRGRAFCTGAYRYGEAIFSCMNLRRVVERISGEEFSHLAYAGDHVVMVEVWDDLSDSGHTDFVHIGYRFVVESELAERDAMHGTVACMTLRYGEKP